MRFDFVKSKDSTYYEISDKMIEKSEKELNIKMPKELIRFYREIGCGFIGSSKGNVNRLMDTISVCDFRLRQGDYEFYPNIELYDDYEENKLVFFEQSMESLMSIEVNDKEISKVYYYNTVIANSLEEFLKEMMRDELYYIKLIEV